jgi:hypothetical protein
MTPPSPNLLTIENYHILDNRNRKILKLCIMKEKSMAKKGSKEKSSSTLKMILPQLNETDLSVASSC